MAGPEAKKPCAFNCGVTSKVFPLPAKRAKSKSMEHKPHTVQIFTEVAPKYEFLNAVMTAGMDRGWRNSMLSVCESALGRKPDVALDLATGTGDVARLMADKWPTAEVQGTDPTNAMLEVARQKSSAEKSPKVHRRIQWKEGVAETIDAEASSVDVITIAFGYRNVAEASRQRAAEEAFRVLKPGGIYSILELGLPRAKILRGPYKLLLQQAMPRFAGLFGPKAAYDYLAQSVIAFPPPEQIKRMLTKAGFLAFAPRPLSTGMCWLYVGKKPATD
jgi:demethylmenaquinone methyltransferase/2-methoxy-6-polyprenyl-1,4-benzoquinol methylase